MDSLPPDQRAALSLLLSQRKSYAEVATLLQIPAGAVHDRAQAALAVLAPSEARGLTADERAEVGDYLLGQSGIADRLKTRTYLRRLRAGPQLGPGGVPALSEIAPDSLPEIPAPPANNVHPQHDGPPPAAPLRRAAVAEPAPARPAAGPQLRRARLRATRAPLRARRLGGILILAAVVVAIIVAVILLTGAARANTNPPATPARRRPPTPTGPPSTSSRCVPRSGASR